MAALAAAAPAADEEEYEYEDDFVDPEDYTDDDFQSVDTADEDPDYDPKLPEVADAKLPVPRRPRRAALAAAAPSASAPASSAPCLLYTSPSPRDRQKSRMPSSA